MSEDTKKATKTNENTNATDQDEQLREQLHAQSMKVLKRLPAMGPVIMLYLQSAHRRFHFISDLEWLLLPPLVNGQCKLYMKKEYPISFVSWAFVSEEVEKRLLQNGGKMRPEDWNTGDRLWIIDIVAPFGGIETMLNDIRKNEFPGRAIRIIAPDPTSGGIKPRELPAFKPEDKPETSSGDAVMAVQ